MDRQKASEMWDGYTNYQPPEEFFSCSKPKQRVHKCLMDYAKWAAREAQRDSRETRGVRELTTEIYEGLTAYVRSLGVDCKGTNDQALKHLRERR